MFIFKLNSHVTSWFSTTRYKKMAHKGLFGCEISLILISELKLWIISYRKYLNQIRWPISPTISRYEITQENREVWLKTVTSGSLPVQVRSKFKQEVKILDRGSIWVMKYEFIFISGHFRSSFSDRKLRIKILVGVTGVIFKIRLRLVP